MDAVRGADLIQRHKAGLDQNMQWNHDCIWNIQLDECYLHDISLITIRHRKTTANHYHAVAGETTTIHSTILYHQ